MFWKQHFLIILIIKDRTFYGSIYTQYIKKYWTILKISDLDTTSATYLALLYVIKIK